MTLNTIINKFKSLITLASRKQYYNFMAIFAAIIFLSGCSEYSTNEMFSPYSQPEQVKNPAKWQYIGDIDADGIASVEKTCVWVDKMTPYAAYLDSGTGGKVSVMKFNDIIWEPLGPKWVSESSSSYPAFAIKNGKYYAAFCDGGDSSRINFLRYNSPLEWGRLGNNVISSKPTSFCSIDISDTGIFYAAYCDNEYNDRVCVKQFNANGRDWESAGNTDIYNYKASDTIISVSRNVPYIAFIDKDRYGSNGKIFVMKLNMTSNKWEMLGSGGIGSGSAAYLDFKVSDEGVPYIAFCEGSNNSKLRVMKFLNNSWSYIENNGVSSGPATYSKIYIYNSMPYVAYCDYVNNQKLTVACYDGKIWKNIGGAGFTPGAITNISLFVHYSAPYVAFCDKTSNDKIRVMKYE